jgi:hypothetical protein
MFEALITLEQRGPIEQREPLPVAELFVDWEQQIDAWEEPGGCGVDNISVFPALENGKAVFLVRSVWDSYPPYSCSGLTQDVVVNERPNRPCQTGDPLYDDEQITKILCGLGVKPELLDDLKSAPRFAQRVSLIDKLNASLNYAVSD